MSLGTERFAPGESSADFLGRIVAGDRAAETEFVHRYAQGVRVLVRRHCRPGDPVVADLTQEVLARVLERLRAGAIRDASALPAYVQTTVVHITSAEYRGRKRVESTETAEAVASSDDPLRRASSDQLTSLLRALVEQLPVARDRELLVRFYLDEESKEDVCRTLGIDDSHFHRVVFRARARLRALLDEAGIREA